MTKVRERLVLTQPGQERDLPPGTVVLFPDGIAGQLNIYGTRPNMWRCTNATYVTRFNESMLPAVVIYNPAEEPQHLF